MIEKSDAASIFRGTRGSGSIEISVPGAFTAVRFSGQQKNPGASAAERGRPSLFKTIDEDRRERHDHINRSGRSTYPGRISVLTSGATPLLAGRVLGDARLGGRLALGKCRDEGASSILYLFERVSAAVVIYPGGHCVRVGAAKRNHAAGRADPAKEPSRILTPGRFISCKPRSARLVPLAVDEPATVDGIGIYGPRHTKNHGC